MSIKPGFYELLLNCEKKEELSKLKEELYQLKDLDKAEAADVLAYYAASIIKRRLNCLSENYNNKTDEKKGSIDEQISLTNKIIDFIDDLENDDSSEQNKISYANQKIDVEGKLLLTVLDEKDSRLKLPNFKVQSLPRPESSLRETSLFTGSAVNEPQLYSELNKEIATADSVDLLVSFIRMSGLNTIYKALEDFTNRGKKLRVITTTYMGVTEAKAIKKLCALKNTTIKISYDVSHDRLHAKAYIFNRRSGFTTAYVGSSNVSKAALSDGREWNIKTSQVQLPDVIEKIKASFETYWANDIYKTYTNDDYEYLCGVIAREKQKGSGIAKVNSELSEFNKYLIEVVPFHYQQKILDELAAERKNLGYYKNLVVAATGTGKTLISAFDYKRFVESRKKNNQTYRLLFVAHRKEILKQSRVAFQTVLRDLNFGELYVGEYAPQNLDYLFISIQTANSKALYERLESDYYDYIVVDEFHHAAANSYQRLLEHFKPRILLGLTATPERMDGKSILGYFDNRVAAEIRLPEAIEKDLLCSFQYFGVADGTDLSRLKWGKGGYDESELERVYTVDSLSANNRVNAILNSLDRYLTDINEVHGIGFCVSVKHAQFMAEAFNKANIPSMAVSAESDTLSRESAREKLESGEIKFIFTVDLYNEGVDIPCINAVLFLRPTQSLTVFIQQLGRGLRKFSGKDCLTVLDYVGLSNSKYNFAEKFKSITLPSRKDIKSQIISGFTSMPRGCYIELEEKAKEAILKTISSNTSTRKEIVEKLKFYHGQFNQKPSLGEFLKYFNLKACDVFRKTGGSCICFNRLLAYADVIKDFAEPLENTVAKAIPKLIQLNSVVLINYICNLLKSLPLSDLHGLSLKEFRMLNMFYVTVFNEVIESRDDEKALAALNSFVNNPIMSQEIDSLLKNNLEMIDFIPPDANYDFDKDCPLEVHCTYSRDQLLVAFDFLKPATVREGVKYLKDKHVDIFMVTLNKSEKDYSPSTMYKDYAISDTLFHWQSQSTTSESSETGRRYIEHKARGNSILLFVREFAEDPNLRATSSYTFLGKCNYVDHEGSRPMSIQWELDNKIPAKYLEITRKLLVG